MLDLKSRTLGRQRGPRCAVQFVALAAALILFVELVNIVVKREIVAIFDKVYGKEGSEFVKVALYDPGLRWLKRGRVWLVILFVTGYLMWVRCASRGDPDRHGPASEHSRKWDETRERANPQGVGAYSKGRRVRCIGVAVLSLFVLGSGLAGIQYAERARLSSIYDRFGIRSTREETRSVRYNGWLGGVAVALAGWMIYVGCQRR